MSETPTPLRGLRVLDLTMLLPGPYCSLILADFGAEVIKIEPPGGGDWLRHLPPLDQGEGRLFRALNRGKKSVALDLKSEQGRDLFCKLASTADVVLEGFRPGVMERLGLGYETLRQANPRLIYSSLSGYGLEGPYRDRAGHDINYIGLAGLLDLTGHPGDTPVVPGVTIADLAGSLWTALGIMAAALGRHQSGVGARVDGSLLGAALSFMPVAAAREAGGQPMTRGGGDLNGGIVCYNVYPTAGGGYVTLGALEPKFWQAFCAAVDRADLVDHQFAPAVPGEQVFEDLRALFLTRTRDAWGETFAQVDACCEPVYSLAEALESGPVRALEMWSGSALLPPLRMAGQMAYPPDRSPSLGQHTAELLAALGVDSDTLSSLREQQIVS